MFTLNLMRILFRVLIISVSLFTILDMMACTHGIQNQVSSISSRKNVNTHSYQLYPNQTQLPGQNQLQGLSGLVFDKENEDRLYFWSLTDRGPNLDSVTVKNKTMRTFLNPDFIPHIYYFSVSKKTGTTSLEKIINLTDSEGHSLSGLPPLSRCANEELPIAQNGQTLNCPILSADPEGLALDSSGNFWIGEEYGPSIMQFSSTGKLMKIYKPADSHPLAPHKSFEVKSLEQALLPKSFTLRKANRGFEAITISGNTLYAMLQSPLPLHDDEIPQNHIPIVKIDIKKDKLLGVLWYPVNEVEPGKIGDMVFTEDHSLLILEQNSKIGPQSIHQVYKVNLPENFHSVSHKTPYKLTKTLYLDLVREGYDRFEKVEGMSLLRNGKIAVVNDNDFGVNPAEEFSSKTILAIFDLSTSITSVD